jgi:ubiquinone/menaquinone biosynthesis C-methylase UbiE
MAGLNFNYPRFGRSNQLDRLNWISSRLAALPIGLKILDVGAGELRNKQFCGHLNYVSQDFCQYEGAGDGVALQTGEWDTSSIDLVSDICSIPAPDCSFDIVLCTEVLEHVPDPLEALIEMDRLIKPMGMIVITAPFCSLTHFAPYHFSSGLSRYWYEKHLSSLGYSILEITANGGWFDYLAQEIWRLPWAGKTYSSKALGWLAFISSIPLLIVLFLMKSFGRDSSELVTFGWHVIARKDFV